MCKAGHNYAHSSSFLQDVGFHDVWVIFKALNAYNGFLSILVLDTSKHIVYKKLTQPIEAVPVFEEYRLSKTAETFNPLSTQG